MPYRVSPLRYRVIGPMWGVLAVAAVLWEMSSDPHRTAPVYVVTRYILLAWIVVMSWRWWRSATLIAADKVTVRTLLRTVTVPWEKVDCFVTETRPVPVVGGIRLQRRVLGIRAPGGTGELWLNEIRCRPSGTGLTWVDASADRLNEFRAPQPPARPEGGGEARS